MFSPGIGVETGAVALICAGIFTVAGNDPQNAVKIILGLLIGIPWGILVLRFTALPGNHSVNQFLALGVLGAGSILICGLTIVGKYVDSTAWLSGWAIALLVLGHVPMASWHWLPWQLVLSMIVGVYLIGVGETVVNDWVKKRS